jgi:hypothetical protein
MVQEVGIGGGDKGAGGARVKNSSTGGGYISGRNKGFNLVNN